MGKNDYGFANGGSGWARGVWKDAPALKTVAGRAATRKLNARTYALFVPDRESFQAFILSEQMRDPVEEAARDIAKLARSLTPRGKDGSDGHVQDGFEVVREGGVITVGDAFPYPRVMVLVENNHGASAAVEFGNRRNRMPGRRMLARAGAVFGDFKGGAAK